MEKIIPHLTEAFILYSDKIDFSKIPDDVEDIKSLDEDPLNFVIQHLEKKGREMKDKVEEELKMKKEEEERIKRENEGSSYTSENSDSKSQV